MVGEVVIGGLLVFVDGLLVAVGGSFVVFVGVVEIDDAVNESVGGGVEVESDGISFEICVLGAGNEDMIFVVVEVVCSFRSLCN